jgi:chitinase
MFDQAGCDDGGAHALCCPTDDSLPTCGWYTHNNGACDGTCPPGTIEIGSNDMYCHGNYQAACCTHDTKSMSLYMTCEWGDYPLCDNTKTCPWKDSSKDQMLVASTTGSGGSSCNVRSWGGPGTPIQIQERKLCCNTKNENQTFSDCEWYTDYGHTGDSSCHSGCPPDRIRIAMDHYSQDCLGKGGGGSKARCCVPKYTTQKEVENPLLQKYRDSLNAYLQSPACPHPQGPGGGGSTALTRRGVGDPINKNQIVTESILLGILTASYSKDMLDAMTDTVWDPSVKSGYPNLQISNLKPWITGLADWAIDGPIKTVHRVVCSMNYWNARAGKDPSKTLVCKWETCDIPFIPCTGDDDTVTKRSLIGLPAADETVVINGTLLNRNGLHVLGKRGAPRSYAGSATDPNGNSYSFSVTLPGV